MACIRFRSNFIQRDITPEMEMTRTSKKKMCVKYFPRGIHIWNFKTLACMVFDERTHAGCTHGRTDGRTDKPKPICPVKFFEESWLGHGSKVTWSIIQLGLVWMSVWVLILFTSWPAYTTFKSKKITHKSTEKYSTHFYFPKQQHTNNLSIVINHRKTKAKRLERQHLSRLMTKPTKWSVRPAKSQISLGIRPVWSESSQCAQ